MFVGADVDAPADLYEHYYGHIDSDVHPATAETLERLVSLSAPFRKTGRWLDIGYGAGALLATAERQGWSCFGTELSPEALRFGEARGWQVTQDARNDPRFPAGGFDVVTMIELIEHVPSPRRVLEQAAGLLRPGGRLYLTTPNGRSLNRWILGASWSIFSPPEHLTIWTSRGLRVALTRCGLRPTRVRTEGFNPWDIIARWRPRQQTHGCRNEAAAALNSALSGSRWRRRVKDAINSALSVTGLGDSLKVAAVRLDIR